MGSTSSRLSGGSAGPGAIGSSSGGGGGGRGGEDFSLVLQHLIKPGTHVKKGQTVAEFDRESMLSRLEDYQASVAQTEASVRKLKAELDITRKAHQQTIEQAKAALEKARLDVKTTPVLGTIDAERVKLALEEAQARYKQFLSEVKFVEVGYQSQIRAAEIELQQAHIEQKRIEANADKMILKAPIDGLTVMQSLFRGGEMAQIREGDQLYPGMMFMQIVDLSSMIVNATVNQVDVESLRIGSRATIRFDAYPGLELPGRVYSIGAMTKPGGMRANFVKEVPIMLKLDKLDARVIPDLSVSAEIIIATEEPPAVAPLSGIFRDGKGTPYVFVKQGDRWAQRPVELGATSHVAAAVRSGLAPGDIIATDEPPPQQVRMETSRGAPPSEPAG
ncbi:MAG TPA: efflux RND transporter periplasmic adaptor subunit [Beijerinckiaceae bacterium]|nr:efflux RND transporter periplasmic adaptor subunit [Beijerinckiaceae bacterium]